MTLAPASQGAPPVLGHVTSERAKCTRVGRNRMVIEVTIQHLPQPDSLLGNRIMASLVQFGSYCLEFGPLTFRHRGPHQQQLASMGASADVRETKERKRPRLSFTKPPAILPSERPESNDSGLLRVERQLELCHPFSHFIEETLGVLAPGKIHDDVVRVANDDNLTSRFVLAPVFGQEVEHVVQAHAG